MCQPSPILRTGDLPEYFAFCFLHKGEYAPTGRVFRRTAVDREMAFQFKNGPHVADYYALNGKHDVYVSGAFTRFRHCLPHLQWKHQGGDVWSLPYSEWVAAFGDGIVIDSSTNLIEGVHDLEGHVINPEKASAYITAMLEDSTGAGMTGGEFDSATPRSTASFAADVKREARRHYITSPEDCVLMAEDLYSLKLPTPPDVAPWFKAICWCTEGLAYADGSISAYIQFESRCPDRFTAAQRQSTVGVTAQPYIAYEAPCIVGRIERLHRPEILHPETGAVIQPELAYRAEVAPTQGHPGQAEVLPVTAVLSAMTAHLDALLSFVLLYNKASDSDRTWEDPDHPLYWTGAVKKTNVQLVTAWACEALQAAAWPSSMCVHNRAGPKQNADTRKMYNFIIARAAGLPLGGFVRDRIEAVMRPEYLPTLSVFLRGSASSSWEYHLRQLTQTFDVALHTDGVWDLTVLSIIDDELKRSHANVIAAVPELGDTAHAMKTVLEMVAVSKASALPGASSHVAGNFDTSTKVGRKSTIAVGDMPGFRQALSVPEK